MKKSFVSFLSFLLAIIITVSGTLPVIAYAYEDNSVSTENSSSDIAEIVSSDMSIESAKSNVDGYYSLNDWTEAYPQGLYVVEYNTYELTEGGTDPENPEDVYVGVVVYRIGGCNQAATVRYTTSCSIGDKETYPTSLGELYFAPGEDRATANIRIVNDDKRTGNQLLVFALDSATSGEISVASAAGIKIFDDEPFVPSKVTMSLEKPVSDKADGNVTVILKRTEGISEICTVHVATKNGTAKAGADYMHTEKEVVFVAGQDTYRLVIPLVQSDVKDETQKNFTLELSDPKGCEIVGDDTLRMSITNKIENEAKKLTDVADMTADIPSADDESSLIDSADSVVNVNDTLDRADMLRTAIGTVNGTAVQKVNDTVFLAGDGNSKGWSDYITLTENEFIERACSYKKHWSPGTEYTYGDEDVYITTKGTYNLNHFSALRTRVRNHDSDDILGNPNTIIGYIEAKGNADKNEWPGYKNYDVYSGSDLSWMKENGIYILRDYNRINIDFTNNPETFSFNKTANQRVEGSAGFFAASSKIFYMIYDDDWFDDHNFKMNDTDLVRAVIPFSVFDTSADSPMDDLVFIKDASDIHKSKLEYTHDMYKWEITVDTSKGGGIGVANENATNDMDKYGFYIGSNIKIKGTYIGNVVNKIAPEILYMRGDNNVVHNTAKNNAGGGMAEFSLTFETLMNMVQEELVGKFGYSEAEAKNHIKSTVTAENCLNSVYDTSKKIFFDIQFSTKQGITINYKNYPILANRIVKADNTLESVAEYEKRVHDALFNSVRFYDADYNEIKTELKVNTEKYYAEYLPVEFSYINVNPKRVGVEGKNSLVYGSNLYEVDYNEIKDSQDISLSSCNQIKSGVVFTLYDENTTYIDPSISIGKTSVTKKEGSTYTPVYIASSIDDSIPFEALYYDVSTTPAISYYTVNLFISDIYVGKKKGEIKEFDVNVYDENLFGGENEKLFTFTFRGGASLAEGRNVNLRNLNSRFTNLDESENVNVDKDAFKPFVELINYSSAGYEYVMYIPTYYNHANPNDPLATDYRCIFEGDDGIAIEISGFDKNTSLTSSAADDGKSEVVASMDAAETQYVCSKVPEAQGTTGDTEEYDAPYFEEQQEFYTYNEHRPALYGFKLGFDFSGIPLALTKIFKMAQKETASKVAGFLLNSGPYVQYGDGMVKFGIRLGGTVADNMSQNNTQQEQGNTAVLPEGDNSDISDEISDLDISEMLDVDEMFAANGAASKGSKIKGALGKLNKGSSISGSILGDVNASFVYNKLTHSWDFNQFQVSVTAAAAIAVSVSIPFLGNAVYFAFTTKGSLTLATGFAHTLSHIDENGKFHYVVTWNGMTIAPGFGISIGMGVGLSGILALEGGASADLTLAALLGKYTYVGPQQEFDIYKSDKPVGIITYNFTGQWRNYSDMDTSTELNEFYGYCYNKTQCVSSAKGDKLVFGAQGSSIQLVGIRSRQGGKMKVTVSDLKGTVLKSETVNMYAESTRPGELLFNWALDDYTADTEANKNFTFKVEIENISEDKEKCFLQLDSIRLYNRMFYDEKTEFGFVSSVNFKIAAYIKLCVLGFNISLEPGYMLIDYMAYEGVESEKPVEKATITLGTIMAKKTWDISPARTMRSSSADVPVLMAEPTVRKVNADFPEYFDTGEFANKKTKTLLMDDIESTAKTQVVNYNNDIYTFYTVTVKNDDGTSNGYQLYYAKNGEVLGLVTDCIYIADFNAFIDGDGNLAVVITANDSTVVSVVNYPDSTADVTLSDGTVINVKETSQIAELAKRTCVKLAIMNSETFAFDTVYTVPNTDGENIHESIVKGISNIDVKRRTDEGRSAVFYVVDAKTEVDADFDLDWQGFNPKQDAAAISNGIYNSLYKGSAEIHYALKTSQGYTTGLRIPLDNVLDDLVNPGFKILSLDVTMADARTVCLTYETEHPYASLNGYTGKLKQIHYRQGQFNSDGKSITFGDSIVIDSVFDYDEKVAVVFENEQNVPSVYINEYTGEYIDDVILGNVQIENAVITKNGDTIRGTSPEPCVFYKTNTGVNYVSFATLNAIANGTATSDDKVNKLYSGTFDEYEVSVDKDGVIYLIYVTADDTDYCDRLMIAQYNVDDRSWNKPRALTYSDAYDADARRQGEDTGAVEFSQFSSFIDTTGNVSVALKSSYIHFSDDYYTDESLNTTDYTADFSKYYDDVITDENGNLKPVMTVSILDHSHEKSRSDIYMISFENMVAAVDVSDFEISNTIFVEDQYVSVGFRMTNVGDYRLNNMDVSLYYRYPDGSVEPVAQKTLSGVLLSGDSFATEIGYIVDGSIIPSDTLLCLSIKDKNGARVLYDSYNSYLLNTDENPDNDKEACYYNINDNVELLFESTNTDIDSEGILSYKINLANIGRLDASSDAIVSCNIYSKDHEANKYSYETTLFRICVPYEKLTANRIAYITDKYNVKEYLDENGDLYFNYSVSTGDEQYSTVNDHIEINRAQQIPEIEVKNVLHASGAPVMMNGRIVRNMKLGDEIIINGDVIANAFNNSSLRLYEIGSDCLSIDNSAKDGTIKIKAVGLPDNSEGYVKVLLGIRDIDVYKYFYINISNTDTVDFEEKLSSGGWTQTGACKLYANNYNLLTTETDGSEIIFDFVGEDLRIYGDQLENGGKFNVVITDAEGNTVAEDKVSTDSDLDNAGMLLYQSEKLENGKYNVRITADINEGEKLSLDCAKFVIDLSQVDTTEYAKMTEVRDELDAPLLSGRTRTARFTLDFSKDIAVAEGKSLADLKVDFDEYESVDGELKKTGGVVTFTAKEIINNSTLVFEGALSSKAGSVMKYVLSDSDIPAGFIVTASNGNEALTAIPSYGDVSYVLKESGIMSVTVADDDEMPDGSIHKSVNVKFMTTPDISRLTGTKFVYKTTDADNTEREVFFNFAGMTDDPRVAVYRADSLELSEDEMSKLFSFRQGIVLNESNYALITSDGDYLENDVTTVINDTSVLDIEYEKIRNEEAPSFSIVTEDESETLVLTVPFNGEMNTSEVVENGSADVSVKATVTDGTVTEETQLTLTISESEKASELIFTCDITEIFTAGKIIDFELVSDSIAYTGENVITNIADEIAVNPALEDAQKLTVNTDKYIVSSEIFFENGEFAPENNILCASVVFSYAEDESILAGSTLTVFESLTTYDMNKDIEHVLVFDSAETVTDENGAYTKALYKSADDVSFTYEETAKSFISDNRIVLQENTEDYMILNRNELIVSRVVAEDATLSLEENGDLGYNIILEVLFGEDIEVLPDNRVYAVVNVESAGLTREVLLSLRTAENRKAVFISDLPVTLDAGEVTSFVTKVRIKNALGELTDSRGIALSEYIGTATLVADMSQKGIATSSVLSVKETNGNKLSVVAEITFNEKLRELSFKDSTVPASVYSQFVDSVNTMSQATLTFEKLADEYTALYSGVVEIPENVVAVRISLGDTINNGNSALYNTTKTLSLSNVIPEADYIRASKLTVLDTAIINATENETINNLDDVAIGVTFAGNIVVENPENITLDVNVEGIEGRETVTFRVDRIINNNSLVFAPSESVELNGANIITVSLIDAVISLGENGSIYGSDGLSVVLALPEMSEKFVCVTPDIPDIPDTPDVPEETTTSQEETTTVSDEPTSEDESATVENETTTKKEETTAVKDETTTVKEETTTTEKTPAGSDKTPGTGDSRIFVPLSVASIVALGVLLVIKKREEK